jgi:uncharacterized protein YkwD
MEQKVPKYLEELNQSTNELISTDERPTQGVSTFIGKTVEEWTKVYGKPSRIDPTPYGYEWWIYNQDYKTYMQVGVEENTIVTIFVMGEEVDIFPYQIGQKVEDIYQFTFVETEHVVELPSGTYRFELSEEDINTRPLIALGDIYAQLYIDKFTSTLSSVRFLNGKTLVKQHPYEMVYRGELLEADPLTEEMWKKVESGTEQQIFELTNIIRQRFQLDPLLWDEKTAEVAYNHSVDMYESDFFSHESPESGTLFDRLKTADILFSLAGENIAAHYTDGPAVVEGWLNSKGHREIMLNEDFTHIGVGVYQQYFTQNYISKDWLNVGER